MAIIGVFDGFVEKTIIIISDIPIFGALLQNFRGFFGTSSQTALFSHQFPITPLFSCTTLIALQPELPFCELGKNSEGESRLQAARTFYREVSAATSPLNSNPTIDAT